MDANLVERENSVESIIIIKEFLITNDVDMKLFFIFVIAVIIGAIYPVRGWVESETKDKDGNIQSTTTHQIFRW